MDMGNRRYGRTIKYKINAKSPDAQIEEVRVARESPYFVYVGSFGNERREAKRCDDHEYHDTWDDAFVALTNKVNKQLAAAMEQLRLAEELVRHVAAMRKPEQHGHKPR